MLINRIFKHSFLYSFVNRNTAINDSKMNKYQPMKRRDMKE